MEEGSRIMSVMDVACYICIALMCANLAFACAMIAISCSSNKANKSNDHSYDSDKKEKGNGLEPGR
jgi:hypothetical protein